MLRLFRRLSDFVRLTQSKLNKLADRAPRRTAIRWTIALGLLALAIVIGVTQFTGNKPKQDGGSGNSASALPVKYSSTDIYSSSDEGVAFQEADPIARERIAELIKSSTLIPRGKIIASKSEWTPDEKQIYTYLTLAVKDVFKGEAPSERITIKQIGGRVGDTLLYIPDAPKMQMGEDVVLLLQQSDGEYMIIGLADGKFGVRTDPAGRQVLEGEALMGKPVYFEDLKKVMAR